MVCLGLFKRVRGPSIAPLSASRARRGFQAVIACKSTGFSKNHFPIRIIGRRSLYFDQEQPFIGVMDLQVFTTQELERLLEVLPEEIRRREAQQEDADDAERRKRSVFASFQELAKKQGVSLSDL